MSPLPGRWNLMGFSSNPRRTQSVHGCSHLSHPSFSQMAKLSLRPWQTGSSFGSQGRVASKTSVLDLKPLTKQGTGALPEIWRWMQGARRENILYGYSTDEQRSSNAKDRQPEGLFTGGCLAALLLSRRALRLSSFVAPCRPPASKRRAHSSFCYKLLIIS